METTIEALRADGAGMQIDLTNLPARLYPNSANSGLNPVYYSENSNIGWPAPQNK